MNFSFKELYKNHNEKQEDLFNISTQKKEKPLLKQPVLKNNPKKNINDEKIENLTLKDYPSQKDKSPNNQKNKKNSLNTCLESLTLKDKFFSNQQKNPSQNLHQFFTPKNMLKENSFSSKKPFTIENINVYEEVISFNQIKKEEKIPKKEIFILEQQKDNLESKKNATINQKKNIFPQEKLNTAILFNNPLVLQPKKIKIFSEEFKKIDLNDKKKEKRNIFQQLHPKILEKNIIEKVENIHDSNMLKGSLFYQNTLLTLKNISLKNNFFSVKISRRIVNGITADVFKAMETMTNKEIALKRFKGERGKNLGKNEHIILEKLNGIKFLDEIPTICKILGFSDKEDSIYNYTIALECGKITLYESLKIKKYNMNEIRQFAINMIMIFSRFQKIGLFYRDIKPSNIIIFNKDWGSIFENKIIDFDVALWLNELKCNENGDYDINLSGTPKYFAPELYKIYSNIRGLKEENVVSKKYIVSNLNDQVDVPNELILENDEDKTLKITKKQLKTENTGFVTTVSASDCFKMDVFSLGMVLLEMALSLPFSNPFSTEIKISDINKHQKNLEKAINEFKQIKKNANSTFLNDLLELMLIWKQKDRVDFLELEDILIYDHFLNLEKNFKYSQIDQKFTSLRTFKNIWDIKDFPQMNQHFFSAGYLSKTVDENYTRTILETSFENNLFLNLTKEQSNLCLKFKESDLSLKTISKTLLKFYTQETSLYKDLNFSLGKNNVSKFKYFLINILKGKNEFQTPILFDYVYRVIVLDRSDKSKLTSQWKFEARNQYFPGLEYYWPSFTSTTKSTSERDSLLNWKGLNEQDLILFVIKIDKSNTENKTDITDFSAYPKEEEVLLYPYFHFKVIKNSPIKLKIGNLYKPVCQIELQELKTKILEFQLIWYDPNFNNGQNIYIQQEIRKNYGNVLIGFDNRNKAIDFLKNDKKFSIVISCGTEGKEFIDKIHDYEKVVKIVLFVGNKQYHQKWATKEKYSKLVGIYDQTQEFLQSLPDKNIFY